MKMQMRVTEVRPFMGYSQVYLTPTDPGFVSDGLHSIIAIPAPGGDRTKLTEIYAIDTVHTVEVTAVPAATAAAEKAPQTASK